MFRVSLSHLSDGLHAETHTPSADDLGLDPDVFSDITVELRLDVRDRRVLAQYDVSATATLECDRTLAMYPQPLDGSHAVLFVPPGPDLADDDDDVQPLATDATEIDLTDAVRDTLLLSVPQRHVSPEGEAIELDTAFGADDDETSSDTRWDALRALRTDDSSTD